MASESLLANLEKKFNTAKNARRSYDRNSKLNLAFYSGRQWVTYDRAFNRVIDWTPPNRKPRMSVNIILPVVRMEYAKLTRNRPVFSVEATTGSPDDVAKAKACKQFLDYLWGVFKFEDTFKRALLWALVTGTSFVKVYYDPDGGDEYEINGEIHRLGDVAVDYCSPFELFIDPFARTLEEASWAIHARVRPIEYVQMKYGVKVPGDSLDTLVVAGLDFGAREAQRQEGTIPAVVVKEYWEEPNSANPYGKYAVWAGGKQLDESENPYAGICPIPFAMMRHIPVPNQLHGESAVTHLRQIQVMYNKLFSDIVENTAKLGNPPIKAPVNSLLKTPEFEPGEVIYYNPIMGGQIEEVKIEPYPSQVVNTLLRLMQQRDDISGLSEVSRGAVPRGVRSAAAVAYLLETDETRMLTTAKEYENMIATAMKYVLRLARAFYDVPRVIRILGENNARETALFKAEDIPPEADVHVEAGSTMPKSVVQMQEYLMNLWDRKIITDPRLVLRMTSYGNMQEAYADLELDTSQAQRENDKLASGVPVEVKKFHNHLVHVVEHNRFRKTVEYEKMPEEKRAAFDAHVDAHEQYIQQMQQMQAQPIEGGEPIAQGGRSQRS